MKLNLPYGKQFIDKEDILSVSLALRQDFITQGSTVQKFEKKVCEFVGSKYAVAVSSCSAGLHLSCLVFENKKFDKIITSPITFASTANAILHSGKKPVFCDIDLNTANIDVPSLKKLINKNNKIGGIIPVHFSGNPCDMKGIKKIVKKNFFFIIEDAAHALGSEYDCGSKVGSCKYSDITVFSLHPLKSITTGEGGVVTTNSREIYQKLKILRSHGIEKTNLKNKPWWYNMNSLGFHYRITDFQCALGISQLKKLSKFVNQRTKIAKKYHESFFGTKYCEVISSKNLKNKKSNHLFVLKIDFKKIKKKKKDLITFLKSKGIMTQVHYIPVPMLDYYKKKGYNMNSLKNAKKYYEQAISIPIYYKLSKKNQIFIVKNIKQFISSF